MRKRAKVEESTEFRLARETDCTVLITGPTGAGKSHLAARIHGLSHRANAPMVSVHLSSLHEGTLESQLFGHERGAFTGAVGRQIGWLQKAQGGTLFLDEIAELSPSAQSKLLEFLQTKRVSPLGSRESHLIDVRIICATNRDLAVEVKRGTFREDLYHRMRVVSLDLPPLRMATDDFGEVVHRMIAELSSIHRRKVCRIDAQVASLLESYSWPGNFRELRNVLEFAVLASTSELIRETDLPGWFLDAGYDERKRIQGLLDQEEFFIEEVSLPDSQDTQSIARMRIREDYESTMTGFERAFIRHAFQTCSGHLTRTAHRLKLPKSTLSRRAKMLGIEAKPGKSPRDMD